MNQCKLCPGLKIASDGESNGDTDIEDPTAHARIHQRQLQMVTGQKESLEEMMEKCFGLKHETDTQLDTIRPKKETKLNTADYKIREASVKCPINKACFEMYKKNGFNDTMACSECGINLKVKGPWFRSGKVREHACMHLNKELFQCRVCDQKTCTRGSMNSHVINIHKLAGNSKNYINHANDHEEEIIATIKYCFDKRPKTERKQENMLQLSKRKNGPVVTCPILKVCYEIHKIQDCKRTIKCSVCEKVLLATRRNGLFNSSMVKQHACAHLDKCLIQCRICGHKCATPAAIRLHLNVKHKLSGGKANYIDRTSDCEAEIIDMIRLCFGNPIAKPDSKVKKEETLQGVGKMITIGGWNKGKIAPMSTISKVCYEVHEKQGRKNAMTCSECGKTFGVKNRGYFASLRVKQHAFTHMDKDMFECRFCDYKSATLGSIYSHLDIRHKLAQNNQNYIDNTGTFEEEIIATIRSCFGEPNEQASDGKPKSQTRRQATPFTTAFATSCRRLVLGRDKSSKIICSVCGRLVVIFNRGKTKVPLMVDHACTHMEKKPYQCKLCKFEASKKPGLEKHLENVHYCEYSNYTCTDLSKDMKDKILDMVNRCFGDDQQQPTTRSIKERLKKAFNQVFLQYFESTDKAECMKCHTKVSVNRGLTQRLDHVRIHIGKPMFKCKICAHYVTITEACITSHLRHAHDIHSQLMTKCEDFTHKFEQQLCEMIIECFGKKYHD